MKFPRANALGIVIKNRSILLEEQEEKHSKGTGFYYRPIGGTIEFGERSDETLVREFNEELGVEVIVKKYITCIENIFKMDESMGHEITQLYVVDFKDQNLYENESFTVSEGDKITRAKWVAIEEVILGKKVLYPNGLAELLGQEL